MSAYRLLVTGARDWRDESAVRTQLMVALRRCHREGDLLVVVHGACPEGADAAASRWCRLFGVSEEPHPAAWDMCGPTCPPGTHRLRRRPGDVLHPGREVDYCPVAGPRRNREMVDAGADLCVAFLTPRSRGARGTADVAEAAGIPTRRVRPDGAEHAGGAA